MKKREFSASSRLKLILPLLCTLIFFGCINSNGTRADDATPQLTHTSNLDYTPTPTSDRTIVFTINQTYWVTANPVGNGKFGYFIGASDNQADVVTHSFAAGTSVILLDVSNRYCKVEGESIDNKFIQAWIYCERLIASQPTPVPAELYIHSP